MRRRRNFLKVAVCCAALLLVALPVSAQDRGRIDLSVVDNTGAVLAGAGVEILAWRTRMSTGEFVLDAPVPVVLP